MFQNKLFDDLQEKFGRFYYTTLTGTTLGEFATEESFIDSLSKPLAIASFSIRIDSAQEINLFMKISFIYRMVII